MKKITNFLFVFEKIRHKKSGFHKFNKNYINKKIKK